jgi:hypothetical protein
MAGQVCTASPTENPESLPFSARSNSSFQCSPDCHAEVSKDDGHAMSLNKPYSPAVLVAGVLLSCEDRRQPGCSLSHERNSGDSSLGNVTPP